MVSCALDRRGAELLRDYVVAGATALGGVPTQTQVIAERFFDDAGGMQLVIHAPFGGRINRAWGMALRKRFCRSFDFELQAAATDDGIVLSLGPQHSFPLETVFSMLRARRRRGAADAGGAAGADVRERGCAERDAIAGAAAQPGRTTACPPPCSGCAPRI
jgi:Lhr-like helicase